MNHALSVKDIEGVYTALMTPFNSLSMLIDKPIDYLKLDDLIEDQVKYVNGVVACSTTGQNSTLSHEEHVELAIHVFNKVYERINFLVSTGSNSTFESIQLSRNIVNKIGPTTFLSVVPYYNKPSQKGIFDHFTNIANNLGPGSNLILYNVPSRTGRNMEAEAVIELAKNPSIIGIKEASGDMKQIKKIISGVSPKRFRVLSGDDNLVAAVVKAGGYGVISASANIAPIPFKQIVSCGIRGEYKKSERLQKYINPLVDAVFCESNPIPLAHIFNSGLRLPLVKHPELQYKIDSVLTKYSPEELGIDFRKYK